MLKVNARGLAKLYVKVYEAGILYLPQVDILSMISFQNYLSFLRLHICIDMLHMCAQYI